MMPNLTTQRTILALLNVLGLIIVSMLFSYQLRILLPFGNPIGDSYKGQSILYFAVVLSVTISIFILSRVRRVYARRGIGYFISYYHPFRRFVVIITVNTLVLLFLFPALSQLQVLYFALSALLFSIFAIVAPLRLYAGEHDLIDDVKSLWESRFLISIWLKNNVEARYSQTILGILWIVLLPLSTSLVLTLAFSVLLRIQLDVPFISFFMAGLVPFSIFQMGVINSTTTIITKVGIISQSYFPREILIIIVIGEVLIDFLFAFIVMVLLNIVLGIWPDILFIYLPILTLIIIVLTFGTSLLLSSLSVLIRDIPQLTNVLMQLLFYLTPIIYPVETIPEDFRVLYNVNPFAPLIVAYRDVIVFQREPEWVTLYFPMALSLVLLSFGYTVFKNIEDVMADMV